MPEESYIKEIRKTITRRYENRSEFLGHFASFVVFNALVWLLWQPEGIWSTIMAVIAGLWFMGLAVHFVNFAMTEARERAIERAIERAQAYGEPRSLEKPKRDRLTRLSADGELVEVVEDDWQDGEAGDRRRSSGG